jgi:hypothetical protein
MSNELAVLNNLPALADQLKVAITIDPAKLRAEVEQFTGGLATRTLAAKNLQIKDDHGLADAATIRNDFASRETGLTAIWKRLKSPLNEMRSKVIDLEHATIDQEKAGKDLVTGKMERYILEQKRIKREAEEHMARVAAVEQRRLASEAEDLMAMGYVKEAQSKVSQAQMTVAPTLPNIDKPSNARIGDKWVSEVTDIIAVLKAVVDGKVPLMHEVKGVMRPLVLIDPVVVNALVARKQNNLQIPGITVSEGVSIGAKRS